MRNEIGRAVAERRRDLANAALRHGKLTQRMVHRRGKVAERIEDSPVHIE